MTDNEIRLECLKQAAEIERAGMSTGDTIDLARRYADFVLGSSLPR